MQQKQQIKLPQLDSVSTAAVNKKLLLLSLLLLVLIAFCCCQARDLAGFRSKSGEASGDVVITEWASFPCCSLLFLLVVSITAGTLAFRILPIAHG